MSPKLTPATSTSSAGTTTVTMESAGAVKDTFLRPIPTTILCGVVMSFCAATTTDPSGLWKASRFSYPV